MCLPEVVLQSLNPSLDVLLRFLLKLWSGSKPVSCCSSVWSGWRVSKLGCRMTATQPDLEKEIRRPEKEKKKNRIKSEVSSTEHLGITKTTCVMLCMTFELRKHDKER